MIFSGGQCLVFMVTFKSHSHFDFCFFIFLRGSFGVIVMGSSFLQGFEVSSSSDSEEKVNTVPFVTMRKSGSDSSSNIEELGSIRVVKDLSANPIC